MFGKTKNYDVKTEEEEKYWLQILAIAIGCLSGVSDGLLTAWSSPFIVKIINDKEHFDISETEASYFAIIPPIATVFTSIIFAKLSDVIGRKKTLLIVAFPQVIAWILKAVATNVYVFYVARVCVGIGFGGIFSVMPMYVGEIVSPKIRGACGSFISTLNYFGQFVVNVLGSYFSVQVTSYICMPLAVLFFVLFLLMPESPYYYTMKKNDEEAKRSLRRLLRKSDVDKDFTSLKKDVDRQMSERGTWLDLVLINSNRKALSIGAFVRISQHLGGTSVFISSIQFIFAKAGGIVKSEIAAMVYTFLTFIFYFMAGLLVDRLGRRLAYITSMTLSGFILLLESVYFYIQDNHPEIDTTSISWFPLVGMIFYVLFGSFGPGIIPTIMIGELFSTSIKAKATIVMMVIFGLFVYISNQLFYLLNSYAGLFAPYLLFSCSDFIAGIVAYYYLPETKGKTLEEIQQHLKGTNDDS